MRKIRAMVACVGLAGLLVVSGARAGEESIPLDKLPKAVVAAVKKRFPKAEMTEAAKETEGDKTEYEVTLKDGATKMDVMLTPEGKITLIEKTIAVKELPKAVAEAVSKKYPKSTIKTAEEVTKVTDDKEALDYYEVLVGTSMEKNYELKIGADGTIKETEEKTKGEDKDEKEKKKDK
jgi:hypothetical protein